MTDAPDETPSKAWYQRWWVWLLVALGALVVLAVIFAPPPEEDDELAGGTTTTAAGETTTTEAESTSTTEAVTTTTEVTTTTTTQPTTTTTTLPVIGSGTYIVPDELAPQTYRIAGYAARLDSELEIIDNFLIGDNGLGLVIVQPTDSYLEVSGEILLVSDAGPIDPIEQGFTEGAYLVGYDIEPGRYRVHPVDGTSYWARYDDKQEIIDNNLSDGAIIVIVDASDWALDFTGTLELVP